MSNNIKEILIKIENLNKIYGNETKLHVLKNINLDIYKNEIVAITGESGSGKTTLLNMLSGIDTITTGSITIDNYKIHTMKEEALAQFRNKNLGLIFQFHNLLAEFTAIENVMIPALIESYNKKEAYNKAYDLLTSVGLSERINHKIGELSGGEAARVAIARALVNSPKLILADEPTGNLDKKNALSVQDILWNMVRKYKSSLIIVTHSMDIASMADRKLKLEYGESITEF